MKNIMFGTSDGWSMVGPIDPASQCIILYIVGFIDLTIFFGSIQKGFHSWKLLFLCSHYENSEFVLIWKKWKVITLGEFKVFDKIWRIKYIDIIWWAATYISFYQCNQWKPSKLKSYFYSAQHYEDILWNKYSTNFNVYLKDNAKITACIFGYIRQFDNFSQRWLFMYL